MFHNTDDSDEDNEQFVDPTAKTAFMTNMAAAIGAVQDLSEQTGSTARARLELSQWLQSQQASVQLQNAHEKSLESSQSQLAAKALQKLKLKTLSFSTPNETNSQGERYLILPESFVKKHVIILVHFTFHFLQTPS